MRTRGSHKWQVKNFRPLFYMHGERIQLFSEDLGYQGCESGVEIGGRDERERKVEGRKMS